MKERGAPTACVLCGGYPGTVAGSLSLEHARGGASSPGIKLTNLREELGLEWGWGLFLQTCELVPDLMFGGFCSAGY